MIDASPSATPMPAQPVATVASPEALTPPADPLSVFVPPSVADPVSNLDFLPVDDAFALEMRAESIEQLAGGDALRRGVSERIEAGRSQTNADLVAGRDRVRVHATLHEHTGRGLAEQAAHLHTTVERRLDVHAGSEDTVLLAGHMRDLWDGGGAIVAAMTDDTVAGGGIRVTTPLDLWVHGLMGVEERIGTCTADAVLLELGATHYEREYGPGVHAAGLAVYAGSLYQSSRSTFRPLMRVSRGVRNLIAGGGGGGGGGDAGAGSAPAASPPPAPAPAQTGAAEESATETLAAGRRAAQAPATAVDTADALTDVRRVPLDALVDSVDARVGEDMGEAGIVMRAEDLPELTRSADTAERLGALQETLRMDATESANEAAGGVRASVLEGAVSMHPSSGMGGPLEIEPPSAVCRENAHMVRPCPGYPWSQGPEMQLGLLGGADRPPQPAAPESETPAVYRRMRDLRIHYNRLSRMDIVRGIYRASDNVTRLTLRTYRRFGGSPKELAIRPIGFTTGEQAYRILREMARQANTEGNLSRVDSIREALDAIDTRAVEQLQELSAKYDIAESPTTQATQRPPATIGPTVTVAAIPPPAHTPIQFGWITAYTRICSLTHQFSDVGWHQPYVDFRAAARRMAQAVMRRFEKFGGNSKHVLSSTSGVTKPEQAYRALEDMARRAEESSDAVRAREIRQALKCVSRATTVNLDELIRKYGAFDALSAQVSEARQSVLAVQAMRTMESEQLPPARIVPKTSASPPVTVASTTVAPTSRLRITGPEHPIVLEVEPAFPEPAGGLVHRTDVPGWPLASGLPGPSLSEAAGARAGDLGRGRLGQPAFAPGTTAAEPVSAEAVVTPSLGETSSFWLQPADPVPAPGTVPFDSGVQHTGETMQPPPVTTTPGSTAPAPGAAFHVPSWVDGDFAGERALLDEYPERVDPQRLDQVRELLRQRGELAAPNATSATGLPGLEATEIDRLLGTGEGASHPVPHPPPSTPERTGVGAGAPPPAADPWRIRPPGMSGGPHPIAFDPWSAPPGPGSQVVYTEAIRAPVQSTGAPPGWQGAETPGFARAASGAIELPFSHREAMARRFSTEVALLDAGVTVQLGGTDALDWSATRWRAVLDDLCRLNAIARSDPAVAAAMDDVDWRGIETLGRILDDPPPSP